MCCQLRRLMHQRVLEVGGRTGAAAAAQTQDIMCQMMQVMAEASCNIKLQTSPPAIPDAKPMRHTHLTLPNTWRSCIRALLPKNQIPLAEEGVVHTLHRKAPPLVFGYHQGHAFHPGTGDESWGNVQGSKNSPPGGLSALCSFAGEAACGFASGESKSLGAPLRHSGDPGSTG